MGCECKVAGCAHEILGALGGAQFVAMTGARHMVGDDRMLRFKLPARFAADGINVVQVDRMGDDFGVTFGRVKGASYRPVRFVPCVALRDLAATFTRVTGLDTGGIK